MLDFAEGVFNGVIWGRFPRFQKWFSFDHYKIIYTILSKDYIVASYFMTDAYGPPMREVLAVND